MSIQLLNHPIMQILNISGSVQQTPGSQNIGILCQESVADDSSLMFLLLEVWVGEEEEHLGELAGSKEIRQELHGIGTETRNISVLAGILDTKGFNALLDIIGDFCTNFHTKYVGVREQVSQGH